jgi:hypothetical protein
MHAIRIAHGIGASLLCAAIFYTAGLVVIPKRWDERLSRGITPGVIGASMYVILCWFGVANEVPVARSAIAFASTVVLVGCIRYRRIATHVAERRLLRAVSMQFVGAFFAFYILAYLFTVPPVTAEYLPLAWMGNVDLMTYVQYTKDLLSLRPTNLGPLHSYLNYVYLQTPGLFFLLGGLSFLFHQDPLSAAMPMQFTLVAFIGTLVAAISRSVFNLSTRVALAVACIFICGPFFRYVVANYFLSTLMATPMLLYLLWTTVDVRARRVVDLPLAVQFAAAYVLLFFIYPFLLLAGVGLQIGAVALMLLAELLHAESRPARRTAFLTAGRTLVTASATFAGLALCFWTQLKWSVNMIVGLSEKGVAGWPLDLISPLAIFAWPGVLPDSLEVAAASRSATIAVFGGVAVALLGVYFWWFRARTTPAQSAFAGLLAGAIILYCAYFSVLGRSYQQWKFASYTVLPLSFVVVAGSLHLFGSSRVFARFGQQPGDRRLLTILPLLIAVSIVGGNAIAHAAFDSPPRRLAGGLRRIADLDKMDHFREITVRMNDMPDSLTTRVALYYLPSKKVHVVSSVFRPSERLSLDRVSRYRPLLFHNFRCEGVGHNETMWIPRVGCLIFAPPTVQLGVSYPFNATFLFVSYEGLSGRLPEGRWNNHRTLPLKISADPERTRLNRKTYLNLLLTPLVSPTGKPVEVVFRMGTERRGETTTAKQEWISLPVQTSDWVGNRLWTLPLSIDLPDRHATLFHELSLTDAPRGRIVEFSAVAP